MAVRIVQRFRSLLSVVPGSCPSAAYCLPRTTIPERSRRASQRSSAPVLCSPPAGSAPSFCARLSRHIEHYPPAICRTSVSLAAPARAICSGGLTCQTVVLQEEIDSARAEVTKDMSSCRSAAPALPAEAQAAL